MVPNTGSLAVTAVPAYLPRMAAILSLSGLSEPRKFVSRAA
jgi:hypothetical protein